MKGSEDVEALVNRNERSRSWACLPGQPSRPPCLLHQDGSTFQLDNAKRDVEPSRAGVGQDGVGRLQNFAHCSSGGRIDVAQVIR